MAARRRLPIQVDMSHAQFLDASATTMFARLIVAERRSGRDLVITGAPTAVRDVFKAAGLARVLTFNDAP